MNVNLNTARRRWITGLGAGSLVVAAAIAASPLDGAARQNATLLQPALGVIEAQEIALNTQIGAGVIAVNLDDDDDDGLLTYGVALDNGVELSIDATTGEIIRAEERNAAGNIQCANTFVGDAGTTVGADDAVIVGDDDGGVVGGAAVGDDGGFVGDDGGGFVGDDGGGDDDGGDD